MSHRVPTRPPALPPDSIEHGAARVTAAVVPIFDKSDGTGADWRLMTESLFKAAFKMLDGLPDDVRQSVAWRVHEGSYRRAVSGPIENAEGKVRPEGVFTGVSDTADLKSRGPRPPH